jgi:hypothetical protein
MGLLDVGANFLEVSHLLLDLHLHLNLQVPLFVFQGFTKDCLLILSIFVQIDEMVLSNLFFGLFSKLFDFHFLV